MKKEKFIALWMDKKIRNAFNRGGLEVMIFGKISNLLNPSTIKRTKGGITDENYKVLEKMGLVAFVDVLAGLEEESENQALKQFFKRLIEKDAKTPDKKK